MKNISNTSAETLISLFGKTENNYSLGFNRMMELSKKTKLACQIAIYNDGFGLDSANISEFKRRLEALTDQEFDNFKKNKGTILK